MSTPTRRKPGVCWVCGCKEDPPEPRGPNADFWANAERTLCNALICGLIDALTDATGYLTVIGSGYEPDADAITAKGLRLLRRARKEARW